MWDDDDLPGKFLLQLGDSNNTTSFQNKAVALQVALDFAKNEFQDAVAEKETNPKNSTEAWYYFASENLGKAKKELAQWMVS